MGPSRDVTPRMVTVDNAASDGTGSVAPFRMYDTSNMELLLLCT